MGEMAGRDVAAAFAAHLADDSEFADAMLGRVLGELPGLGDNDELRSIAREMVKASVEAFGAVLTQDVPPTRIDAPWLTLKYARRLAWEGVSVDEIVRGYRLGQEVVFERLASFAGAHVKDAAEVAEFMRWAGGLSFRFVDVVCTHVVEEYAAERDRLLSGAIARRAEMVRALVARERVDLVEAERILRYRLAGTHVAMLLWPSNAQEDRELASLDRAATAVARLLGCDYPLVIHDAPELLALWATVSADDPIPWTEVERLLDERGVVMAAGSPQPGVAGFRASRRQAERGRAVGAAGAQTASDGRPLSLLRYEEISLVSLLTDDIDAARAFVSEELGRLAADDDASAALRATLLEVTRSGAQKASEVLFLHRNTVAQRVRKAEELIGRPLAGRQQEVEAALLVCKWLGARVLSQPGGK